MHSDPTTAPNSLQSEDLGRRLRLQVVLALVGIALLVTLLGVSTYNITTVLVPDRGGTFREGVAGAPQYLNPLRCAASDVDMDFCTLLYRGLTDIDKQGRVIPDLAESWTVTDGLIYTFRLRTDQFWHDGEAVTVDDVLFTIGILREPTVVGLPELTSLWRTVGVEKLDDFTVRFTLTEPFTPFLDYTSIGLLPEHIWTGTDANQLASGALNATPIGTGPMRVTHVAADLIRLEPNPFYADAQAYLDALEIHFYVDHQSLLTAFQNGEIDGIRQVAPSILPQALQQEDLQLLSFVQSSYLNIVFNLNSPDAPFLQDGAVRQALYYALDREQMIDEVLDGQGIVAHSLLLPENWAYHREIPQYRYDPVLAAQLMDAAGWTDNDGDGIRERDGRPMQFLLHTNNDPTRTALIEYVAQAWQAVGVRAVATPVDFSSLVSDFLGPRRFEAALIGWELTGDPDPYPLWHSTQAIGGGQNYSGWQNEEADILLERARALVDAEERGQLYAQFQEIFVTEAPALLLHYPVYTYGVSKRVHNVQIGSLNHASERFGTFPEWYMNTRRVPSNQIPTEVPPEPPTTLD